MTTIKPGYIVRHSNNTLASSIRGVGQFIDNQIKKIKQLLSKLLNPTDYKLEKIDIIQEITKISIDLLELENNGHRFKHNTNYLSKYIKTLLELTQLRFDDFNKDNSGKMKYQEKINQLYNIVAQANNFILENLSIYTLNDKNC